MPAILRLSTLIFFLAGSIPTAYAWQAVQKVQTYAISGRSGPELYASIGRHGPKAGITRAIALTTFTLTWTRDYQRQGDACTLASALPKLTITTTVPEPSGALPPALRQRWDIFAAGVRDHEKVHGVIIEDMVRAIEAATVGLTVADDRRCSKIRDEMKTKLSVLSLAQRQKSRDFDKVELGDGGTIHRLVLALVAQR